MKRKDLFCAIAVVVSLLGCAGASTKAPPKSAPHCPNGECIVVVTITDCNAEDGISLSKDPLKIKARSKIVWVIDPNTPGYLFQSNGIEIGPDPEGEIENRMFHSNGTEASVHIKHNKKPYGIYYAVNVMKLDGTKCRKLDPWIHNE